VDQHELRAGAHLTRRDLLKQAGGAALAVSTVGGLTACGGSGNATTSSDTTGKPRYGGTLTAGLTGGSSSDTLDAQSGVSVVDFSRIFNLSEPLVELAPDGKLKLALAEEITPNSDATVWTVRVRPGVEFHNGKTLTADDVIYSLKRILNPKNPLPGATPLGRVNAKLLQKLDTQTVRITCSAPFSTLLEGLAGNYALIVPAGYDPKRSVGTGPFKLGSFTPGSSSTFVKNPNYWQHGLPYLDTLVIQDYSDETSQINALLGGQVDAVDQLSSTAVPQLNGSTRAVISNGGTWTPFVMRIGSAPFVDRRVRQAMRLIVGRTQMREQLFSGYGLLGNDIFSINDPVYDHSLPQRVQDIEQAKSLLRAAGQEHLSLQLVTADLAQGTLGAAQSFAQQASAAGVKVGLRQITVTELYGPNYLKWPFTQDVWFASTYFNTVTLAMLPTSPFNETNFSVPRYTHLYNQALSELNASKRAEIAHEMQTIEYDQGGFIIPYFVPNIDGVSAKVHGDVPTRLGLPLNSFQFKYFWLS
jgi:peptide/nickel transport system substrate-binding protein